MYPSGPRVGFLINVLQVPLHDVRVNLRRRDIRMTQHLLDGPQIRAVFQQMRGEARRRKKEMDKKKAENQ